jgi:hypothetical protein
MGEMSELGWLMGLVKHALGRFFAFPIPAVTLNLQNASFIPAYPMTLFIGLILHGHKYEIDSIAPI